MQVRQVGQVRPVLEVEEYDADDVVAVAAGQRILEAARSVDAPFLPPLTLFRRTMDVRFGWESSPVRHLLARVDGRPVAVADLELTEWDNTDLAWAELVVDPAHRRRGHGSELLAHLLDLSGQLGRSKFGANGWATPASEGFATAHGFSVAQQEIYRVQAPRELPPVVLDEAYAEAARHAADYDLVRVEGRTPDTLLPLVAELTAAINDAPLDDLDIEEEVFPAERIRSYESATIDSGHRLYRVVALHRSTGTAAGHTALAVDAEVPALAHQHDTSVMRAHRGHRLGLLLKAEMLRWLAEAEPQLTSIDTWNAESNDHMIAVNERLGYRVRGRQLDFQPRS
jgi:GNAT superfamily N-acetyltransferase